MISTSPLLSIPLVIGAFASPLCITFDDNISFGEIDCVVNNAQLLALKVCIRIELACHQVSTSVACVMHGAINKQVRSI